MRRIIALMLGSTLGLAAGQALACPYPDHHHRHHREGVSYGDDGGSYDDRRDGYPYEDQRYGDERYESDRYYEDRYGPSLYDDDVDAPPPLIGASPWYMDGRHPKPPCDCEPGGGDVLLWNSFFDDAGGVGPIPEGGWYGGGYYAAGYGYASAHASAGASASASVSIRGGRHYGGHHKGGHKGGKG